MRRKILRKAVSIFLCSVLLLNAVFSASAAGTETGFSDVSANAWYAEPVRYLSRMGIIGGKEDGKFHPEAQITRAEFLKLLAVASGKDLASERLGGSFSDVPENTWYTKYVYWGVREKIINGVENGRFAPNSPITRQQIAVILWRYNKNALGKIMPRYQKTYFKDASSVSSWAKKEVEAVEGAGIIRGYSDRTFRPQNNASRAEAAQILYKYLGAYRNYKRGCSLDDLRYVMHGGGEVGGRYQVSNSLEALQEASRSKNHIVELDFSWTTDNQLVCLHNWGSTYPPKSTLKAFLQTKIYGALTPVGMESLSTWLRAHPEVQVVADFKERNVEGLRQISTYYPDLLGQFIPYLYHTSEYEAVHNMGYENMILIFYQMTAAERNKVEQNVAFAREKALSAIAVSPDQKIEEYEAEAKKAGVPLLAFVIDSPSTMQTLARQGTDGFITNKQAVKIQW